MTCWSIRCLSGILHLLSSSAHPYSCRPALCRRPRYSCKVVRIYLNDIHRFDNSGLPTNGGHRTRYIFAHNPSNDRQSFFTSFSLYYLAFNRNRIPQLSWWFNYIILLKCAFRRIYHIFLHYYLLNM